MTNEEMTREEAIADIRDNIKPIVGGKSLDMAIQSLTAISELSKSLKAVNRYDMDEKVLIGFNMAVAIFNKCFGENRALKNEQSEQNVGMCQQDVGEISEKQTDGEWIAVIDEIDSLGNKTWHYECSICGNSDSGWGDYKYCPNCGCKMKGESE